MKKDMLLDLLDDVEVYSDEYPDEFDELTDSDFELGRDLTFSVNEYKRTVTVVEYGHKFDGHELILKRYPWVDSVWLEVFSKRFLCPNKVVVTVKCHKDDDFDPEIGKAIAVRRLNRIIINNREAAVRVFERYIKNQMEHPAAKKQLKK